MTAAPALSDVDALGHLWRDYWRERWHRAPQWPKFASRASSFLSAPAARSGAVPVLADSPTGKQPFLGVLTIEGEASPSTHSGVITFPGPGHLLTVAPTRTGKGACHIVPNLLLYAASAVVLDVKGENYDITAEHRARMFPGAKVIRFAPFSDGINARYNPLDFVRVHKTGDPTRDTFDDTRLLAEMLLPGKGNREEFWDTEARTLLHALILDTACRYSPGDPRRNLRSVTEALFRAPEGDDAGYVLTIADMRVTAAKLEYSALQALSGTLMEHEEKVRAGVFSTCRAEMKIWLSERLQTATETSDFSFSELKESMCRPVEQNPAPTTLYIVVPPEYLTVYRSLLRTMIGLASIELTRPAPWSGRPGWRQRPPAPVLFFLDEFAALGKMTPVSEGLAYLAGYDVQLWPFVQNVGQLKEIYGEAWHNFPANAGATSFFGVNDPDTAEYIERLLGETPEEMRYYSHHVASRTMDIEREAKNAFSSSSGTATSHRFVKEKVMSAAEIRALPEGLQLIFVRNREPILASKLPYYEFELINRLAGQWLLGA